ncbi:hypothetical protein M430DRAFT_197809 [Amorphotheca resinae ATCC 22711]|uniref:Uncharacterized protein n=1 Tax=Amorphotheca resinae ATCC 22711 TaxID=857342 RepID=A0A2T3B9T4_AMORE|nr:hypothetical protein M430DRAFT_197809 [Amorphotheca resinae ATCC 22711]PSS25048.1 hypothetical protein M430DRAFT_197809 [Amorphotheca resinae ATCC 22711]
MIRCCCFYLVVPVASPRTDNQLPFPLPPCPPSEKKHRAHTCCLSLQLPPLLFSSLLLYPVVEQGRKTQNKLITREDECTTKIPDREPSSSLLRR